MTVKQPVNDSGNDLRKSEGLVAAAPLNEEKNMIGWKKLLCAAETETDQESIGSSEDMESPRSVAKIGQWTGKKIVFVHSQVLRIRQEDSHLGEDIGEGFSAKDKLSGNNHHAHQLAPSHVDVVIFSRPILPASRLSGKAVH